MQIFDATTATPSAAYIKVATSEGVSRAQPFIPFGNPDTGGLTAPGWTTILAWLTLAKREVEREMRKNPPEVCSMLPDGKHNWTLVESGCECSWPRIDIAYSDDDEGRAEGARRISVVASTYAKDDASDGEDYFLRCRTCMVEVNVDDVDFI